jgi:CRP-like cAMP-binding protein
MKHALTPQEMLTVMRTSPLFAQLFPEEFRRVIGLLQIHRATTGEILATEGEMDGTLYLLRRGRLNARRVGLGRESRPVVRFHLPGDVLNEDAFLTGCAAQWTLEAIDDVEVWTVPASDFRALVHELGDMDTRLGTGNAFDDADSSEGGVVSLRTQFEGQRAGEQLLWSGRRHGLLFVCNAWLGWLFTAAAIVMTIVAASSNAPAFLDSSSGALVRVGIFIAGIAVAAWHYLDWRNDIYVVSDQRVFHRERVLMIVDQQNECPLDKVQNVRVDRPTWLHTLLDIGHIVIEAQGARANVTFRWVRRPDNPVRLILGSAGRIRERREAMEKDRVRKTLRRSLHGDPASSEERTQSAPAITPTRSRWNSVYHWFIPPMRETRGADFVYHKHWLLLVRTTGIPMVLFIASVALQLVVAQLGWPPPSFVSPSTLQLIGIAASLALLGRWIWCYEDWRNDVYIVTPDRIIDFDRSPFGLAGTQQKTAGMNSVQNVSYHTRGILDNLFNIGDVVIHTGANDGQLVFERIWNPRRVQREIVDRVEDFQRRQQQSQQDARQRELAEWLTAYDQIKAQS